MSSQPVEANVVLTSDNSQYNQSMQQSAGATNALSASIDSLSAKISSLSKLAGKSLIGMGAGDVATITATTAAFASYEKQMAQLNAQSAILTKTNTAQKQTMKDYTLAVKDLRREYGVTTTAAASLVQTLSKITNVKQSRDLKDLSKVFEDMSKATGENADGLAQSLTGLQKMMGTQVNHATSRKYADQFTYLAAKTNTSAQGLIDFTAQLAPAARAMGMTSDQVAGFATSFTKAGQDSGPAAMVFTKITNDITHSLATGSPEIAHYANLLGITQKAFKKMDAGEQVISILEKLQSEGKGAATELARLGLDGPRSLKALQSIIAQGGLRLDQREASTAGKAGGPSKGAAKEGADNAQTLSESFDKLSESVKQFAETFGSYFAPTINFMVKGLNKLMDVANAVTDGPFGKMVALFMGLAAPIMIGVGALLLFAGTLTKVAMAFAVFRSSGAYGIREGLKGGAGMTTGGAPGTQIARGGEGAFLGQRGAQIATDPRSSWAMRSSYNAGQGIGGLLRGSFTGGVGGIRNLTAKFTGKEVEAGPVRSPLSYAAGGAGRFMQNFVTPQFDQMRYANPADRKIWMNNQAPWASIGDKTRLLGQMGRVSGAESDLERIRKSELAIRKDTGLDPMEKQAKLDSIKTMKEEAKTRLNTSQYAERSTRETIEAQGRVNAATKDTTVGMERLGVATKQLGANVGGGMLGGMRAGAGLAWRSGAVGQMGGMGAMMAGSALGSSTLMLGGMGASIGSLAMGPGPGTAIGAGIGGTAGAILDVAKSNKGMFDMIHQVKDLGDETQKSGVGLSDYTDQLAKSQQGLADKSKAIGVTGDKSDFWLGAPSWSKAKAVPGMTKNAIEGLFGRSDVSEATGQQNTEVARQKNQEQAARDLAAASGVSIRGTKSQQVTALDDFMGSLGAQRFKDAGIDPAQYYAARQKAQTKVTQADMGPVQFDAQHNPIDRSKSAEVVNQRNQKSYDDMTKKLASAGTGITDIVKENLAKTDVGKAMEASKNVQEAEKHQENVEATYKGIQDMYTTMQGEGKSNIDVMHSAAQAMSKIGEENNKPFELTYGLFQKAQQNEQMQMPLMTRAQQFQSTIGQLGALENVAPTTPAQRTLVEQKKMETAQGVTDQVSYVKQMLLMQDQYEIQKQRASDAYALQQTYQLHDYNLQRSRAEYSFNLGRTRATADYHRQLTRGNFEFNLQRKRQEQDFNHQTQVMAKQMAMSVYDIYNRVQVERTSSAAWLISNAHDQLVQMQQQETNLKKLRKMGMTDDTIQQLKLTDPAQAQQAANLVATATVGQIKTMNKVIGAERIKAAKDLVQDPSSLDNAERMRGYRRARQQALDDHNRSLKWAREDFMRQMKQQKEDFDLMMHQQATDFQTSMNRQEKAYRLSMKNSAEDLANAGKEITGSIEQILKQGSTHLTGYAQATAQAALDTFTGLKKSTRPVAIAIMKDLSEIFGFEYKVPKLSSNNEHKVSGTTRGGGEISTGGRTIGGAAEGGVIPGWSPGTDDTMVPLSGGEAIMRPEWARKVGKKNIDKMNHAARHGGYAKGGVVWPLPGGTWSTYPGHDGIDLNAPNDDGKPYYAAVPGKISYTGTAHGYGDAVFETGPYGTIVYGHASKVGVHAGEVVKAGQWLGNVGSTGHSTGPHLHIGFPGGTPQEILALLHGSKHTGYGEAGATGQDATAAMLKQVLKDLYPSVEKKAHAMQGVHPLFPGDMSSVINRYGMAAIKRYTKKYGVAGAEGDAGAIFGNEPSSNLSNERLVHIAANRMGWKDQWGALRQIVMHESGFNNTAQNPSSTAYGMFQFLDGTWGNYGAKKTSDPWKQTQAGMKYIKQRYKDPNGAWKFWQDHNWYGDGAVFNGAQTIGVGEKGPEAVIPLNQRGGEFLTRAMMGVDARRIGLGASPMSGGINVYNTRVDRSTNFTGAIHVTANDPNELIRKMQARQRVLALSRPSLTGSAA